MTVILPVRESDGLTMQDKCDTCAFRPETEASLSPLTRMKAQLCAEIPTMFLCHEAHEVGDEVACAGWTAIADKLQREGFYEAQPEWRTKLRKEILEVIQKINDGLIKDSDQLKLALGMAVRSMGDDSEREIEERA